MKLKNEVENVLETMKKHTKLTIKNTVDTVVEKLNLMQNMKEQKTDLQLKALKQQIS